jgi:hypothetical protein
MAASFDLRIATPFSSYKLKLFALASSSTAAITFSLRSSGGFAHAMSHSERQDFKKVPYRGTKIPPGPSIMDAITSTATIALPMSNILCLSISTSLKPNRNLVLQKTAFCCGKCAARKIMAYVDRCHLMIASVRRKTLSGTAICKRRAAPRFTIN